MACVSGCCTGRGVPAVVYKVVPAVVYRDSSVQGDTDSGVPIVVEFDVIFEIF